MMHFFENSISAAENILKTEKLESNENPKKTF